MRSTVSATLLLVFAATSASGEFLGVNSYTVDIRGTPPGYTVNRIEIDFGGRLYGQQMVVELTSGSIYQDGFGGETPPSPAFVPVAPTLEADTFVAIGGYLRGFDEYTLVVGGSTEFPGLNTGKQFDTQGINVAWAPAPGVVVVDQADYPIAQLTLSDDAYGRFHFFSNSGGQPFQLTGCIAGGIVLPYCPEPSTAAIAAVALAVVGATVRGRSV